MQKEELLSRPWFQELQELVQQELQRRSQSPEDTLGTLDAEKSRLQSQVHGWTMSLANPNLPLESRRLIEQELNNAAERIRQIDLQAAALQSQTARKETLVSADDILQRLERLAEVLANHNPSRTNIELSLHIDRIDCHTDGRVVLRTCRLGVLGDAIDFFAGQEVGGPSVPSHDSEGTPKIQPRRRARRRIIGENATGEELKQLAAWSTDPNRFADLDECWFEEVELELPESTSWHRRHAMEVAAQRALGRSQSELAEQFGVSIPTIRKALRHAYQLDPSLQHLSAKRPLRRWHEDHVTEVMALIAQGLSIPKVAKHVGKSEPTIRKAVLYAQEIGHGSDGQGTA